MTNEAWHARKQAQWERVRSPGLQLSRTGEDKTTYILRCSADGFEDVVVLGRLRVVDDRGTTILPGADMADELLDEQILAWTVYRRLSLPPEYRPDYRTDWKRLGLARQTEDRERRARRAPKGFGQGSFGNDA